MSMDILVYPDEKQVLLDSIATLPDDAQLLEFGCGGSTVLFASLLKSGQHLTSVEHNQAWYEKVRAELERLHLADRVTWVFVPLTAAYAKREEENILTGSERYRNPPVEWDRIRWVFNDGIMRGPVLNSIHHKLRPGTPVFLHDYVGRSAWYDYAANDYTRLSPVHTLLPLISKPLAWNRTKQFV
jgi:hypothetical protein